MSKPGFQWDQTDCSSPRSAPYRLKDGRRLSPLRLLGILCGRLLLLLVRLLRRVFYDVTKGDLRSGLVLTIVRVLDGDLYGGAAVHAHAVLVFGADIRLTTRVGGEPVLAVDLFPPGGEG